MTSTMTPKQIYLLDKLGIDANQKDSDIFDNLLELANWLYDEIEKDEQKRFIKEIKRIQKPTN